MKMDIEYGGRRCWIEIIFRFQKISKLYLQFENACMNACLGKNEWISSKVRDTWQVCIVENYWIYDSFNSIP